MTAQLTPEEIFRRTRLVAPQMVAVSVVNAQRIQINAEQSEHCLKASEVLFLAASGYYYQKIVCS